MRPLLLLAFLAEDDLALVADPLALIGLGTAPLANVRGDLADELLVDAFDHDLGLLRRRDGHAIGRHEIHVMRITKRQFQDLALHLRAVTHTLDFQLSFEALADASYKVRHHRTRHAPLLARALGQTARRNGDSTV